MAVEQALVAILRADATVTGLVSNRIYPIIMPDRVTYPAITYLQVSNVRDHTYDGPSGLAEAHFQVDCWAKTYGGADILADAVRDAMDGYNGAVASLTVQSVESEDEGDVPIIEPQSVEARLYGKRLDFVMWYTES